MKIEITTREMDTEKEFRSFLNQIEVILDNFSTWKYLEINVQAHFKREKEL